MIELVVLVAQWYNLQLDFEPGCGKQWSRDHPIDVPATPMLPYANH